MTEWLFSWIRSIVAASLLSALALQLTPDGSVKRVTRFTCGILLACTLLSPVLRTDEASFSLALEDYRRTVSELTEDLEEQEKQLLRTYIEQKTAAYILDEARSIGMLEPSVSVKVKWGDDSWVPCEVSIRGEITAEQRYRMSAYLAAELGIPAERQHWNDE